MLGSKVPIYLEWGLVSMGFFENVGKCWNFFFFFCILREGVIPWIFRKCRKLFETSKNVEMSISEIFWEGEG